jgi:hypothetical protein
MVNETETYKWVHLSDDHHWDSHSDHFQLQEEKYNDLQDYQREQTDRNIYVVNSILNSSF